MPLQLLMVRQSQLASCTEQAIYSLALAPTV
jgi:hypothetical protein